MYFRGLSRWTGWRKPETRTEGRNCVGDFRMNKLMTWVAGALFAMTAAANGQPADLDPENTIYLDL